jgi:hypothetical protein
MKTNHRVWLLPLFLSMSVCAMLGFSETGTELGKVEGFVLTAGRNPLHKAALLLQPFPSSSRAAAYMTTSDTQGRFVFDDIEPGAYTISADRNGYIRQNENRLIQVASGQHVGNVILTLPPQAMIYGRVFSEDGEPQARSEVQVLRQSYSRGRRVFDAVAFGRTQDDGSFVIGGLEAGRYYVLAVPNRREEPQRILSAGRGPDQEHVATYWPNAIDVSSAASIRLAAGDEMRGVEIRFRRESVFRIRGKAISPDGTRPEKITVSLNPAGNAAASSANIIVALVQRDGAFEFEGILPGIYTLQATSNPGSGAMSKRFFGRSIVTVRNGDSEDVRIYLGQGLEVRGRVMAAGSAIPWASTPYVFLTAINGAGRDVTTRLQNDGAFRFSDVAPDVYRVKLAGLPDTAYVKAVNVSGRIVHGGLIDLTNAGAEMQILVSPDAAELTGIVHNNAGHAAAGALVQIWNSEDEAPRSVTANADGSFRVGGLAPSEYSVLAWEEAHPDTVEDPAVRQRFQRWIASVSLQQRSTAAKTVTAVSRDALAAEGIMY